MAHKSASCGVCEGVGQVEIKAARVLTGVTLAPTEVSATVPLVMAVNDIEGQGSGQQNLEARVHSVLHWTPLFKGEAV